MTDEEQKGDAPKGKKGAKPKGPAKEVSAMQKGDYTVHLLLQKTRGQCLVWQVTGNLQRSCSSTKTRSTRLTTLACPSV